MGITPRYDMITVGKYINSYLERIDKAMLLSLTRLGEECVNHARSVGDYWDQTGNLRNSVGYVIIHDGQVLKENFQKSSVVKGARGSNEGVQAAKGIAQQVATQFPVGYVLIVVAGMHYAADVERKGRNVLTSAEDYTRINLPVMISRLRTSIKKMKP